MQQNTDKQLNLQQSSNKQKMKNWKRTRVQRIFIKKKQPIT